MAKLTIFIITLTVIFLLLIQKLSLRFVVSTDYSITLDYSFFTLVISSGKASSKKRKKRRISIKPLISFVLRIIKSSKITVKSASLSEFDILLETKLYNVLFSGIILLYEETKRRIMKLNARKSN